MTIRKDKNGKIILVNNDEKNDDWMKSLPGYKDELKIHDELAKKHKKQEKK